MFAPPPISGQVPTDQASSMKAQSNCDSDDSDWDDDDFGTQKFNIKIKPVAQVSPSKISASVEELRASVGTWKSMANINLARPKSRRHHQSTVQLSNEDLNQNDQLRPACTPPHPGTHLNNQVDQNEVFLGNMQSIMPASSFMTLEPSRSSSNVLTPINITNKQEVHLDMQGSYSSVTPHPQSSIGLSVVPRHGSMSTSSQIPVAFVVQESLNVRSRISHEGTSLTYLIGRLKLALPINALENIKSSDDLVLSLITTVPWDRVDLNKQYTTDTDDVQDKIRHFTSESLNKRLSINMDSVKTYAQGLELQTHHKSYIVTPELLKYTIRSQDRYDDTMINPKHQLNPVEATSHWLCGAEAIKIRIDLKLIENALANQTLSHRDIRNLRISVCVNARVISQVSKPEADWIASESRLVWFFPTMETLHLASSMNGVTSCMARLEITGGLSEPSDIMLHFSIGGKTLSGTNVILDKSTNYRMVRQKFDVKTGLFVCEPNTNDNSRVLRSP